MERGSLSLDRLPDGTEIYADLELLRLAFPRRTYMESHVRYIVDRASWLYRNRDLVQGLEWVYEPKVLRFFLGRLRDKRGWGKEVARKYLEELGEN
jgi:tryptophanase